MLVNLEGISIDGTLKNASLFWFEVCRVKSAEFELGVIDESFKLS